MKLALVGALDEHIQDALDNLVPSLPAKVAIDLREIHRINSIGISKWLDFVTAAASRCEITLEACSPDFVEQLNMIRSFRTRCAVRSVLRRFVCEQCNVRGVKEFVATVHFNAAGPIAANDLCPDCASIVTFEEDDDDFFHFATDV